MIYISEQGRTQDFFPGEARLSTLFEGKSKRGREAPERGEGVSLPHEGAFVNEVK